MSSETTSFGAETQPKSCFWHCTNKTYPSVSTFGSFGPLLFATRTTHASGYFFHGRPEFSGHEATALSSSGFGPAVWGGQVSLSQEPLEAKRG